MKLKIKLMFHRSKESLLDLIKDFSRHSCEFCQ